MSETGNRSFVGYRSLFWPVVLIGVGVVWLLGNLHIIAPVGFYTLAQLWPLLLIAIGLDIIFGRSHPLVGALIGLGVVGLAAVVLISAPALGLNTNSQVKTGRYTAPIDNAASAQVNLGFAAGNMTVHSLSDSPALIDANLNYIGDIDFGSEGGANRTVHLQQRNAVMNVWPFLMGDQLRWDVGLNPAVPTDLHVQSSSGDVSLDLANLKLKGLTVDMSSGDMRATLPASAEAYNVNVQISSGDLTVNMPDSADVNASVNMSSGDMTFNVPARAGVQVNVRSLSSGDVNVPSGFTRTADNGRKTGSWESSNYNGADYKIVITVENLSSGDINIRQK